MSEVCLEKLEERGTIARLKFMFMLQHNYLNVDADVYVSSILLRSLQVQYNMLLKPYMRRTSQFQIFLFPRTVNNQTL